MNAWLVKWSSMSSTAVKRHPVVAVFDEHVTVEQIAERVELLYAQAADTFAERVAWVRNPERNPYRAQIYRSDHAGGDYVSCGHHPWLEAHLVRDLTVEADEVTDTERIAWKQINADGSIHPQHVVQPRS